MISGPEKEWVVKCLNITIILLFTERCFFWLVIIGSSEAMIRLYLITVTLFKGLAGCAVTNVVVT